MPKYGYLPIYFFFFGISAKTAEGCDALSIWQCSSDRFDRICIIWLSNLLRYIQPYFFFSLFICFWFFSSAVCCWFFLQHPKWSNSAEKRAAWRQARLKSMEKEQATDGTDNNEVSKHMFYACTAPNTTYSVYRDYII